MPVEQFYQACLFDVCDCDKNLKDCVCPVIGTYAEVCVRAGSNIAFRDVVPMCGKHSMQTDLYGSRENDVILTVHQYK